MSFWANDKWLGETVDQGTFFSMNDKLQHLIGYTALWLLLALTPWSFGIRLLIWEGFSFGVEALEMLGLKLKWKLLADKPSYKDLTVNHIGLLLAALYLWAL